MLGINLLVAMVTVLCTHSISANCMQDANLWSMANAPEICILHTSANFEKVKDTIFLKQIIFLNSLNSVYTV